MKKTHFILFKQRRTSIKILEELIVDNVKIERKTSTKFLGVMIDANLNFNDHVQYIKGKVARGIGILCKCRRLFKKETLVTLYNAFLYPYLAYCVSVWGSTYDTYLDPLIKLQKRAMRIIDGVRRDAPTSPIYLRLRILKFKQIYMNAIQLFVFKFHKTFIQSDDQEFDINERVRISKDKLPDTFIFFQLNGSFHSHDTKSKNKFRPPALKGPVASRTVRVLGVNSFNYFLDKINIESSFLSYKIALKNFIITNELSSLDSLIPAGN